MEKLRATLHMIGDVPGEDDAMDDDDDEFDAREAFGSGGKKQERVTSSSPTSPTRRMRTPDSDAPSQRRGRVRGRNRRRGTTGGEDAGDGDDEDDDEGEGTPSWRRLPRRNRRLLAAKVSARGWVCGGAGAEPGG